MEFSQSFPIKKPRAAVWKIMVDQFDDTAAWSSDVSHSTCDFKEPTGTVVGDVRACKTPFGDTEETITKLNRQTGEMSFLVEASKMAPFVKQTISHWRIEPVDETSSLLKIRGEMDISFPFIIFAPLLKMQMKKTLDRLGNDFTVYVESDGKKVSPLKEAALAKLSS